MPAHEPGHELADVRMHWKAGQMDQQRHAVYEHRLRQGSESVGDEAGGGR
jgi:hypothetical protein